MSGKTLIVLGLWALAMLIFAACAKDWLNPRDWHPRDVASAFFIAGFILKEFWASPS